VTRLARRFPHIDILVNNAGAIPGDEVIEIDEATWRVAWEAEAREDANHSRS
jgi:NADP-dependent 3-hydroxy acid dehydrogenase YdfG